MKDTEIKNYVIQLLDSINIHVNGKNPWDIQVYNDHLYPRVFNQGTLGLGEAYMDKWWDCQHLDQFFDRVISEKLENRVVSNKLLSFKLLLASFFNLQTIPRSLEVGKKHYDLGNDLFKNMLDSRMNYSCAYWDGVNDLDSAQINKLELICQKLQIQPGMKILDIGCGFGSFAKYVTEKYQASVVGVTISKEQQKYAMENCKGLPVEIRFEDYRKLNEEFDRIVSIGMFEHVGYRNYRTYFETAHRCLADHGLFLLHTIGSGISVTSSNEWTVKYIFPNGMLPSIAQIGKAYEDLFVMEDWHNFGADYDKTLMAWHDNFVQNWSRIADQYDERFYRMWVYYLLSSAGSFRARYNHLWQIVFSKNGVKGVYYAPRHV